MTPEYALELRGVRKTYRGVSLVMRGAPWPRWMAGDVGLAFVLMFAFIASIYLRCYFRWGFGKVNVAAARILRQGAAVQWVRSRSSKGPTS